MCGLVGVFGTCLDSHHHDFVRQGIQADVLRGKHSTGVAAVRDKSADVLLAKAALHGVDFVEWKPGRDLLTYHKDTIALLGHNRYATIGEVNKRTAHPYNHDHITLTHNGTVKNHRALSQWNYGMTDSDGIAKEFSVAESHAVIPRLDGAYAFVWHDQRNNTVNVARNHERELFIAKEDTQFGDNYLYASEKLMLEWLADRNNLMLEYVREVTPHRVYSFQLGGHVMTPSYREVGFYKPVIAQSTAYKHTPTRAALPNKQTKVHLRRGNYSGAADTRTITAQTEEFLKSIGRVPNEDVTFITTDYTEVKAGTSTRYTLMGVLKDDVDIPVISYGVPKGCYYNRSFTHGEYTAKVVALSAGTDGTKCLMLDGVEFVKKIRKSSIKRHIKEEKELMDKVAEKIATSETKALNYANPDDLPDNVDTNAGPMKKSKFVSIAETGCCYCNDQLPYDPDHVHIFWAEFAVCDECLPEARNSMVN